MTYRYRRYRRQRLTGMQMAAIAIGAAVLLSGAAGTTAAAHHGTGGGRGSYTQTTWARALLRAAGYRRTPCNVGAIAAWERAEGGHWVDPALHNPLNDARWMLGSWLMPGPNPAHVRSYPTWGSGLRATLRTLGGPDYVTIRAALADGNDAQAVATAVAQSPWGTNYFSARCRP
jgi:hypothetical protein